MCPGQAGPQPVLGLQGPAGVTIAAGFVLGDPRQQRTGHARRDRVGQPIPPLFGSEFAVSAPPDSAQPARRPTATPDAAPGPPVVGQHQSVHLTGQARPPSAGVPRRLDDAPRTQATHRRPPGRRLALGPPRAAGRAPGTARSALSDQPAVRVDQRLPLLSWCRGRCPACTRDGRPFARFGRRLAGTADLLGVGRTDSDSNKWLTSRFSSTHSTARRVASFPGATGESLTRAGR